MEGVVLEGISKDELFAKIKEVVENIVPIELVTTAEAATILGVTKKTVWDYENKGLLTNKSVANNHLKYDLKEIIKVKRMTPAEKKMNAKYPVR